MPKDRSYHYINPRTRTQCSIIRVDLPEGPIVIKRWNPSKGTTRSEAPEESISTEMIWRFANACKENFPINVDRIFGGSYNTRSVLETLVAHTPEFSFCYPGRIESINDRTRIQAGHKHIIWTPDSPHAVGILNRVDTDIVISEVPTLEAFYEAVQLPDVIQTNALDIEIQRRHAQIQIALYFIGKQLGYKTWIAQNDKGILYNNRRLGEYEGVINSLQDVQLLSAFQAAINAALLIDCMWFKNGRLMPAVMEVEHSTGVTSGLTRMKHFQDQFTSFPTRFVIVASDDDRDKVLKESNKPQFSSLNTKFFSYSAVEELYALCQRRKIKGVTEEFLDCYMEPMIAN